MKKSFFDIIKKIDLFIILFLGLIGIACFSYIIYTTANIYAFDRAHRRALPVVDSSSSEVAQKTTLSYLTKIKDTYIFMLKAAGVSPSTQENITSSMSNSSYNKTSNTEEAVNFLFITPQEKSENLLFNTNTFIYKYTIGTENYRSDKQDRFDKNLYLVIENDTNKDGKLNSDDAAALYISSYNGSNLKCLSTNLLSYSRKYDYITFAEYGEEIVNFYSYNTANDTKILLKSVKQGSAGSEYVVKKELNDLY